MGWMLDWCVGWNLDWLGSSASVTIPGAGSDGVATFALELQNGYTVTYRWPTDIIKTRSGKEQRISRNDQALESYSGKAMLFGTAGADMRAIFARFAAAASTFTLALPHEELTLRADAVGAVVPVETTLLSDWMNPGQRVVVVHNRQSIEAVIQSTTADTITLDIAIGSDALDGGLDLDLGGSSLGVRGARIMPTMPILLDPEQAFPRYRTAVEMWDLRARAAAFGFARELATLALGPYTALPGLDLATVTERYPGACSSFAMANDGLDGLGNLDETTDDVVFHFVSAGFLITTAEALYAALSASTRLAPTGTWGTGNLTAADVFDQPLTGGELQGPIGTGASLTTYAGDGTARPVWHHPLENKSTITDSIQAMTQIIDHDGVPYSISTADMADWGRAIAYQGKGLAAWQWLKLFIATVKGQQEAFWLSTWRNDLPFVSKAANTITVRADVGAWFPRQRQYVQVVETNGTQTRAKVTAAVDHGDGTWTLTIGTTLASSSVRMVSWLELVRFTKGDFAVTFNAGGFELKTVATGVQQ